MMKRLMQELRRLYFLPAQRGQLEAGDVPLAADESGVSAPALSRALAGEADLTLLTISPEGMTRSLVLNFLQRADWPHVAMLHQALQAELELPAPAIAIAADNGFQLWFSLAEPVPPALARQFLAALRRKYLADLPLASLSGSTDAGSGPVKLVPSLHSANGKWSAFIDPTLGGMFCEESGLDMAPNPGRQADMLAGLRSMTLAELQHALTLLGLPVPADAAGGETVCLEEGVQAPTGQCRRTDPAEFAYDNPQSFLLAVMNDPSASTRDRIEAAKALLPYFTAPAKP